LKQRRLAVVLFVLLAILLMLWIRGVGHFDFDWEVFRRQFRDLDYAWLWTSIVAAFATYIGRALRWEVLIRPIKPGASLWNLLKATIIGFTALALLGRPGEFARPYLIAQKEGLPVTSQFAAWTVERIYDLLAALVIFGFALSLVGRSGVKAGPAITWVLETGGTVVGIACLACLAAFITLRNLGQLVRRRLLDALGFLPEHHLRRVDHLLTGFLEGAESLRNPGAVVLVLGYTILEWVLIAGCNYALLHSFPGLRGFGWVDVLIFTGFIAFGSLIQLPGIGGGPQVVAAVVLHELFAVPIEAATSIALVVWAVTFLCVVPVGVPLALHEGVSWTRMKEIGEESV
jgi:uncharacterized membrane protein YbhN (UPF0104 family)